MCLLVPVTSNFTTLLVTRHNSDSQHSHRAYIASTKLIPFFFLGNICYQSATDYCKVTIYAGLTILTNAAVKSDQLGANVVDTIFYIKQNLKRDEASGLLNFTTPSRDVEWQHGG